MTLLEILVAVTLVALVAAGVAWRMAGSADAHRVAIAQGDASHIRDAVRRWRAEHDASQCPTVSRLIRDRALDQAQRTDDPWGERYRIACDGDDVVVSSAGADRRLGTRDDVTIPGASTS